MSKRVEQTGESPMCPACHRRNAMIADLVARNEKCRDCGYVSGPSQPMLTGLELDPPHGLVRTPWPSTRARQFAMSSVRRWGKLWLNADFVQRTIVELTDGTLIFVVLSEQAPALQNDVKKQTRALNASLKRQALAGTLRTPTRESPFVLAFGEA